MINRWLNKMYSIQIPPNIDGQLENMFTHPLRRRLYIYFTVRFNQVFKLYSTYRNLT